MENIKIAQNILKIAKDLISMQFETQKALDKYLQEHPNANRLKHRVKNRIDDKKNNKNKLEKEVKDEVKKVVYNPLKNQLGNLFEKLKHVVDKQKPTDVKDGSGGNNSDKVKVDKSDVVDLKNKVKDLKDKIVPAIEDSPKKIVDKVVDKMAPTDKQKDNSVVKK